MFIENFENTESFFIAVRESRQRSISAYNTLEEFQYGNALSASLLLQLPKKTIEPDIGIMYFLQRKEEALANLNYSYALIDEAISLLHSVMNLIDSLYIDAVYWYYIESLTWERTGKLLGVNRKTAALYAHILFDFVDGVGIQKALRGEGLASG